MEECFERVRLLIGEESYRRLSHSKVIIFGVGGVGSWCAESLVRSGVIDITLVDTDRVDITNINRQLPATYATIGEIKVDVMKKRLLEINPEAKITAIRQFYTGETAEQFRLSDYDYIIDAIDVLKDKALLILKSCESSAKLFSSMGAALKVDPSKIGTAEFWKVQGCPLAAALRSKFKKNKTFPAKKFQCVYSPETFRNRGEAIVKEKDGQEMDFSNLDTIKVGNFKGQTNGTLAHTTAIFGFTLAGLVIQDLLSTE